MYNLIVHFKNCFLTYICPFSLPHSSYFSVSLKDPPSTLWICDGPHGIPECDVAQTVATALASLEASHMPAVLGHLGENRNKLFLKPQSQWWRMIAFPQLFPAAQLSIPTCLGRTLLKTGKGWDFQSIGSIWTAYADYSGDDKCKTHVRFETNTCSEPTVHT